MDHHQDSAAVSLRDYVEMRLELTDRAIDLAREGMENRLESMNEFREQLKAQSAEFGTRDGMETLKDAIHGCVSNDEMRGMQDRFRDLNESVTKFHAAHEAKASQTSVWLIGTISLASMVVSVIGLILRVLGK